MNGARRTASGKGRRAGAVRDIRPSPATVRVIAKPHFASRGAVPPDAPSTPAALIGMRAGLHPQDRLVSEALIREAFDQTFFSTKYRRQFIGRTLEPDGIALETYLRFVARDRLDPNEDFSEEHYLRENPDIMEGVASGKLACGFEHWLRYGKAEGRPTFKATATDTYTNPIFEDFDAQFFCRKYKRRFTGRNLNNPDVALSLYMSFVLPECLDPNAHFSENDYLRQNPDVQEAVQRGILPSGFAHWAMFGRKEGRKAFPALTFDGPLSADLGIVIPQPNAAHNGLSLCLRREEFDSMLRYFDKAYFRRKQSLHFSQTDRREKHRVFHHYLNEASTRCVDPNSHFSESHYLACNADIATAVKEGGYLCGYHHWVQHGQAEHRVFRSGPFRIADARHEMPLHPANHSKILSEDRSLFRRFFQYSYYRAFFPVPRRLDAEQAFAYFIDVDLMRGVVPVDENIFDEQFYLCYYGDVQAEKAAGRIPSGYYHYVLSGCMEGRLPNYRPGPLLKAKLGDSADPVGIANISIIARRMKPILSRIQPSRPCVMNVFIPTLDGDLMFGGYIAFMNFLCRVVEHGVALRFIIREDPYGNAAWFLRTISNRPRWLKAFSEQEVVNATLANDRLAFHSNDLCIAYSTWTMFDASSVSSQLLYKRPLFFIQEYEPIFHEHNSFGFVMASAYRLPHIPIFNSSVLERYFRENKIGVSAATEPSSVFAFENALTPVRPSARRLPNASHRRLICYARPERHAGRNMFEVCILALREAVRLRIFPGEWEFVGIGSLGHEYEIELGPIDVLKIMPRMPQADYEQFLLSFDVGLSLMWAPHPSVMPFELASAGVVTVTNEYANRTGDTFDQFGANLIFAVPTLEGIVAGLREAVLRSENLALRRAASTFDWPRNWDEVFTEPFIENVLSAARQRY